MPTVASAGRESGSRTRQKKPKRLQPSMAAASSSSAGMLAEERSQDDDRERDAEGRLRQGHAEGVVQETDRPEQDVQRQDRDGGREQQAQREQHEECLPARERKRAKT